MQKFIEEVFSGVKLLPRARAPGSLKLAHLVKVKGEGNVVVPDVPAVFSGGIDGFGLPPSCSRVVGQSGSIVVFDGSAGVAGINFVLKIFLIIFFPKRFFF